MRRRDFVKTALGAAALWPAGSLLGRRLLAAAEVSTDVPAVNLDGAATTLLRAEVAELADSLRGTVLLPGQAGYDEARRVWNGMFDKRPALIARCAAPSDAMLAVTFARQHRLLTAVRGGGHSLSGKSTCDGGLMIDMSAMQSVRVDPVARVARVESGALLGHLDRETAAFGLVTTAGTVSDTGAAGLTLGGGFGRVGRRFGLTCDNLRSVDIVTADGRLLTASDEQNRELFWGLRGGGGNFGVATSFEYRLHAMNPTVLGGDVLWPLEQARDVLRFYADFSMQAPDELNLDPTLFAPPGGPPLLGIEMCWSADHAAGEQAMRALRSFGKPIADSVAPIAYVKLQKSKDAHTPPGVRIYTKSGFIADLASAVDVLLDAYRSMTPGTGAVLMQHGGGAVNRVAPDATAFPNRNVKHWVMVNAVSRSPAEDAARIAEVRAAWKSVEPLTRGFYVNAMSEEEYKKVDANYGRNYPRLVALKTKYDPGNLFRLNANIVPKAATARV